jgi:hypothetical protein
MANCRDEFIEHNLVLDQIIFNSLFKIENAK